MRADRALSGRLICVACGNPYGVRKKRINKLNNLNYFSLNKQFFIFLLLLTLAFILVII